MERFVGIRVGNGQEGDHYHVRTNETVACSMLSLVHHELCRRFG